MKTWERRPLVRPGALFLLLLGAVAGAVCAAESSNFVQAASLSTLLQGRAVYLKNCVFCHGPSGDGRGEMGLTVLPRPRNFRAAVFKFRSTPSGTLPTDDDLARTIRGGLSGTAMPIFATLREREVRAVIAYVKSFSPRWNQAENYVLPMPISKTPSWFRNPAELTRRAQRGKPLFTTACAPCHGPKGDGRGDAASGMKDSFDEPVMPSDLRQPLRCGPEPKDIYRTLLTGLDGTPMPAFAGALSEDQRWEIIAHVLELRREAGAREP